MSSIEIVWNDDRTETVSVQVNNDNNKILSKATLEKYKIDINTVSCCV